MMKVTGPMNVQMKWLSTLSQHLWGGTNEKRKELVPFIHRQRPHGETDGEWLGARGKLLVPSGSCLHSRLVSLRSCI